MQGMIMHTIRNMLQSEHKDKCTNEKYLWNNTFKIDQNVFRHKKAYKREHISQSIENTVE